MATVICYLIYYIIDDISVNRIMPATPSGVASRAEGMERDGSARPTTENFTFSQFD